MSTNKPALDALKTMTALCRVAYGNLDKDIYAEIVQAEAAIAALEAEADEISLLEGTIESRDRNIETLVAENKRLAALEAVQVEPVVKGNAFYVPTNRVYLVATGEVHDGLEQYTRHDTKPPMCDAETLYSRSAA